MILGCEGYLFNSFDDEEGPNDTFEIRELGYAHDFGFGSLPFDSYNAEFHYRNSARNKRSIDWLENYHHGIPPAEHFDNELSTLLVSQSILTLYNSVGAQLGPEKAAKRNYIMINEDKHIEKILIDAGFQDRIVKISNLFHFKPPSAKELRGMPKYSACFMHIKFKSGGKPYQCAGEKCKLYWKWALGQEIFENGNVLVCSTTTDGSKVQIVY
jgi:hypothetical protein